MSYFPYSIVLVFSGFLFIVLGIYGLLNRNRPGMLAFSVFMLLLSVWPLAQAVDLSTADLTLKIFLLKLRTDVPFFAGIAYLVMVLQLIGRSNWVTRQRLAILSIFPMLGLFFNWTSPNMLWHYNFQVSMSGPFPVLLWSNGILFWILVFYAYALYLTPVLLLARSYRDISPLSSRQITILIIAIVVPLCTDILFRIGISPVSGFNLEPVTYAFMGLIIAWGIFYYKAFDTVPVARNKLISSMKDGMVVMDAMDNIVDINPAAQRMIGQISDNALGRPAEDAFATRPELINFGENNQPVQIEIAMDEEDSSFYDVRNTPIRDQKESYLGRMLILRDITQHKIAEDALRKSEDKYRNLFTNMTEEVHFWKVLRNEEGLIKTWRLVDANPPALETWGKTLQEIKGKTTEEIFGPGSTEHYMPIVQKIMKEGIPFSYEDYFPQLDKHFRFTSVPVGNHFITTGADITEIKKFQKELQTSNEDLQATTEELQTSHEELIQTQGELRELIDKLEVSNRELEQFAYVASHDLQEPLRMVGSFTQLLERRYKGQLDDDADDYIGFIIEGSHRMKYLIDDLLAFSRLNTEAKEFKLTDLENALADVLLNLKQSIEENKAIITHDHLPIIMADSSQIRQVFQNLISNAIKFHSEEPPKIHISAQRSGNEWLFRISDNGIGIDLEHQKKIFNIFNRLHTREEYEGTGIGLSICKKIVERHGGRIWVESEPGRGSTFYFTIPNA